MALDDKILKEIAGLDTSVHNLDRATLSPGERGSLYTDISNRIGSLTSSNPETILESFGRANEAVSYAGADTWTTTAANRYSNEYNEVLEEKTNYVTGRLNKDLEGAKTIAQAASKIEYILARALKIKKPSQEDADSYKRQELAKAGKPGFLSAGPGNPDDLYLAMYRNVASKFLTPVKEKDDEGKDKVTGYTINEEAIAKLMKDIRTGSVMYTIAKAKADAEAKAAEEKK